MSEILELCEACALAQKKLALNPKDSQALRILVTNMKKAIKFLGKEDYRSIGETFVRDTPEGVKELIKTFAKNKDTARALVSELKLLHPDLFK